MIQVRYYSRTGNTKLLADTIAKTVHEKAISIDEENAPIKEKTDFLFIGGALYAYGLDSKLKKYISELDSKKIKKAVVFSTSWLSKHSIDLLKKYLKEQNIPVLEEYIYFKNKPSKKDLEEAEKQVKELLKNN